MRLDLITDPSRCLTPAGAAGHLGIGRSTVCELMKSGRLRSIKIGRSRRIPLAALAEYVAEELAAARQR